jgi:tRNA C32,U32 (ribose-2'-O)-methylase TrmJ
MQYTPNYNLKKPDYTNFADVMELNDNMDTLDTVIKDITTASDVTALQLQVNTHIQNMAQHNQIMEGTQKVQLVFGINRTLNCLTIEEVNI